MQIDVWSDFACPFCYIGKKRLEGALAKFEHGKHVKVVFRSFELDPNAAISYEHDVHEMLSRKYGMPREKAIEMNSDLAKQAASVGLTFNFDTLVLTNTFDAHRLTHFAAKYGKQDEMSERLFRAYFTDSKHLGERDTLADLAAEVGLDRQEALAVLESDAHAQDVRGDEEEASRIGVRGVPFFVINRKYAISGAQPNEVFLNAIKQAWDEAYPALTVINDLPNDADGAACSDGTCAPSAAQDANPDKA